MVSKRKVVGVEEILVHGAIVIPLLYFMEVQLQFLFQLLILWTVTIKLG